MTQETDNYQLKFNQMDDTARQAMFELDDELDSLLINGDKEGMKSFFQNIHPYLGRLLARWRHPS